MKKKTKQKNWKTHADTINALTDNPFGKTHGAPSDSDRHVGDLGNFKTDGQGNAKGSVSDSLVKLFGEHSVLGVRPLPPPVLNKTKCELESKKE